MKNSSFYHVGQRIKSISESRGNLRFVTSDEGIIEILSFSTVINTKANDIVFVVSQQSNIEKWVHKLRWLLQGYSCHDIEVLPLPYISNYGPDRYLDHKVQQVERLSALINTRVKKKKRVYVTTLIALSQRSTPIEVFQQATKRIQIGQELELDILAQNLLDLGYRESLTVETEGLFAIRGGIMDVFPPGALDPIRIEFFLDSVKSMRAFDRLDQRSIREIQEVIFGPAHEFFVSHTQENKVYQRLFDELMAANVPVKESSILVEKFKKKIIENEILFFLPKAIDSSALTISFFEDDSFFVFLEPLEATYQEFNRFFYELKSFEAEDRIRKRIVNEVEAVFDSTLDKIKETIDHCGLIEFSQHQKQTVSSCQDIFEVQSFLRPVPIDNECSDPLDLWVEKIRDFVGKSQLVKVITQTADRADRIFYLLKSSGFVNLKKNERALHEMIIDNSEPGLNAIEIGYGYSSKPICFLHENLVIIPDFTILGILPGIKGIQKRRVKETFQSFSDLLPAGLVVHHHHGVGRYRGLTRMSFGGIESEFLIIEYAGNDKIYLPVDRLNILSRYHTLEDSSCPRPLDRLGGSFERKKQLVKSKTAEFAKFLLQEQAKRAMVRGLAYGEISDTYHRLEADFPYEETEDQLSAIEEIEADFASGMPMDRLLCGDVGFGKTEVALRAAMRTALEGYQTLIFVPTTLLCHQHYRNFSHRMEKYAVKVAQVNRFVSPANIKRVLGEVSTGKIDILIGTHMLLTKDVRPKNLGLIIVDEEQRFGVNQKERLKRLRSNAHIISMSATPIPRTLHQSLIGLKQISIIATPPRQRLPVQTYIGPYDTGLIKKAVDQELSRGGQVFYIHNRVETIETYADELRKVVSDARIAIAHGQMHEHHLEKIVQEFIEKKYDVLLCSTIIEAGVDMPNVNTLIVSNADRFGLSQLYQIRGRVGRSHVQAYAYLLTDPKSQLSPEAKSRLAVIANHQELGAGFHIANRDLEIRGAGDLLGKAQSGHVYEVGLETYRTLLRGAIQELKGEKVQENLEVEIKLPLQIMIPESFIRSERERLKFYKDIFSATEERKLEEISDILVDRFGSLPKELKILFKVAYLKLMLVRVSIVSLVYRQGGVECKFHEIGEQIQRSILKLIDEKPQKYKAQPKNTLFIAFKKHQEQIDSLELLELILIEINELMYKK